MNEIDGDQFVRSLAAYVRENGEDIMAVARNKLSNLDTDVPTTQLARTADGGQPITDAGNAPTLTTSFVSILSTAIGFGAWGSPSDSSLRRADKSSTSSFAMDPYHLAYLEVLFRKSPLIEDYVSSERLGGEGLESQAVATSAFVAQNTVGSPYLSFLWSKPTTTSDSSTLLDTDVDQDLLLLFQFFRSIPALRIAPVRLNHIANFNPPSPVRFSLAFFWGLRMVELDGVHPRQVIWGGIRRQLRALTCRHGLSDAGELIAALQSNESLWTHSEVGIKRDTPGEATDEDPYTVLLPLLTHLELSGNSLVELPSALTSNIPRCMHLDLASNALTTVPPTLSLLSDLTYVNLSGNCISSLSGAEDRLRNVAVLLLRANMLENLLGVESLLRLRVLDVAENKIWDVYEVGRLAALLNVNEIWIEDNPLTKLPNYRTNIFTYFKGSALHLLLDGAQPSPTEKKVIHANLTVAAASPPHGGPLLQSTTGGRGTKSVKSRDGKSKHDEMAGRSVASGKSSRKSEKRKKKKVNRHMGDVSEAITEQSIVRNGTQVWADEETGQPTQAERIPSSATTPTPQAPSSLSTPGPQRRFQRLAEIEKTVDVINEGETYIEPPIDSADLVVNRTSKRKGETKSSGGSKVKIKKDRGGSGSAEGANHVKTLNSVDPSPAPASQELLPGALVPSSNDTTSTESVKANVHMDDGGKKAFVPDTPGLTQGGDLIYSYTSPKALESASVGHLQKPQPPSPPTPRATTSIPHIQPTPAVGTHIANIGPYRRIFDYGRVNADTASMRSGATATSVMWVAPSSDSDAVKPNVRAIPRPMAPQRTSSGPDVESGTKADFHGIAQEMPTGARTKSSATGIDISSLPPLRVGVPPSDGTSCENQLTGERREILISPTPPPLILSRPLRSNMTGSVAVSTRSAGRSIATAPIDGRLGAYAASVSSRGSYSSMPARMASEHFSAQPVPSAPTIPFMTLTNALKLYLVLNVLRDGNNEKCLCWMPASCVVQIPSEDIPSRNGLRPSEWFGSKAGDQRLWRSASYLPAQRPCYMLLTNQRVYIFEPGFRFPFVKNCNYEAEDIRYDSNIASMLRMVRCVRLRAIARVDVGLNRQYFVLRYFVPTTRGSAGGSGVGLGSGVHPMAPGGLGPAEHNSGHWESVVILTRDKIATTKFLDGLIECLGDEVEDAVRATRVNCDGANGRIKVVNQDLEWAIREIRDRVLIRAGKKEYGYPIGWRPESEGRGQSESVFGGKWLGRVFWGLREQRTPSTQAIVPPTSLVASMITDEDEDAAAVATDLVIDKVNFEFLKTYLLVGLLVVPPPTGHGSDSYFSVRPTSLAATKDYIYLFEERHDVWPPLFFPPETNTAAWVNASVTVHSMDGLSAEELGRQKGLLADAVGMVSQVTDIGRVRDVIRCEKWRTWRWAGRMGREGALVQNGYVGICRTGKRRNQNGMSGSKGWGWAQSGYTMEGNLTGWGWWVRVVFRRAGEEEGLMGGKSSMKDQASPTETPMPVRPPSTVSVTSTDERYWDLVFGTLDSANEFLNFLRDVRGVNEESDIDEVYSDMFGALIGARSRSSSSKVREDGVEFIIGDD